MGSTASRCASDTAVDEDDWRSGIRSWLAIARISGQRTPMTCAPPGATRSCSAAYAGSARRRRPSVSDLDEGVRLVEQVRQRGPQAPCRDVVGGHERVGAGRGALGPERVACAAR